MLQRLLFDSLSHWTRDEEENKNNYAWWKCYVPFQISFTLAKFATEWIRLAEQKKKVGFLDLSATRLRRVLYSLKTKWMIALTTILYSLCPP